MDRILDRILSVVMILGTVTVVGILVRNTVAAPKNRSESGAEAPTFEVTWQRALEYGTTVEGPADARVTVVEFTDLECPACRAYDSGLKEVVRRYPKDVKLVYLPFPLSIHRFAKGAANATECIIERDPDKLRVWIETVYSAQDSLGLMSWGHLASRTGIGDTSYVSACALDPTPSPSVEASIAFGTELGVTGTPSLMVNGWRYQGLPSTTQLEAFIKQILDQRPGAGE